MKQISLTILLVMTGVLYVRTGFSQKALTADSIDHITRQVADWQLRSWATEGWPHPKYDWTNGAAYAGLLAFARDSKDPSYFDFLRNIGRELSWTTGPRRGHADDYCVAQTFGQLSMIFHEPSWILPFRRQADSILSWPHTESLEFINGVGDREWAWCDALFMGPPAFAYLSSATKDLKYLDSACAWWWKTTDYLYDREEHLYYRDSHFFDQREKNGKKVFWSRGNGWVMGGLVRMLENMPKTYPAKPRFETLYRDMAAKIIQLQQPDGTWHASLLNPEAYPVKETSGTGFYCYALAWGINHKLLKKAEYLPSVLKAWAALSACVHPDGKLGNVQHIGAKPESVTADDTESYGVGAFLLAGSELRKIIRGNGNSK
jgi:rhamnogalacturonyl hydrolase YesR